MINIPDTTLTENININSTHIGTLQNYTVTIPEYKKYICSKCYNKDNNFVYNSNLCTRCDLKKLQLKEAKLPIKKIPVEEFSKAGLYNSMLHNLDDTHSLTAQEQISSTIKDTNSRTTFSFDLVKLLQEVNNSNVIVSPSSIIRTLVLLSLGSSGATKQELFNLFNKIDITIPENLSSIADTIKANDSLLPNYLARMKAENQQSWLALIMNIFWSATDETARLDNFNAVLTANGLALSENMKKKLTILNAVSGDQVLSSDNFVQDINKIFAIKTKGSVQEIANQGDFTGSEIAILNAIHFYGKWKSAFTLDDYETSFILSTNELISVKSMSLKTTNYKIASLAGWQALRLFYKGDKYAMDIILPSQKDSTENIDTNKSRIISQLLSLLNEQQNTSSQEEINIRMPLFSFSSEINLLNIMKQHPELKFLTSPKLNLNDMIQDGYVGAIIKILQKCYIDVNEKDTTATAVTKVIVSRSISYIKQFIVNKPFYFSLSNTENNDIAMAGFVQNPSINK